MRFFNQCRTRSEMKVSPDAIIHLQSRAFLHRSSQRLKNFYGVRAILKGFNVLCMLLLYRIFPMLKLLDVRIRHVPRYHFVAISTSLEYLKLGRRLFAKVDLTDEDQNYSRLRNSDA